MVYQFSTRPWKYLLKMQLCLYLYIIQQSSFILLCLPVSTFNCEYKVSLFSICLVFRWSSKTLQYLYSCFEKPPSTLPWFLTFFVVHSGNSECLSAMAKVEILKQFQLQCLELGLLLTAMPSEKQWQVNAKHSMIVWGGIQHCSKTSRSVPQNKCV